ncbi:hypothetical protein N9980_00535 [bacterium]|nr:hypothetical protein [bacterium]
MTVPYTSTFTVWKQDARDDYGGVTYSAPTVFKGNYRQGGSLKLVDSSGQEFVPVSTYWSRLEVVSGTLFTPTNDNLIIFGNYSGVTDPLTLEVQQIRGQTIEDNSMFGQPSDYIFGTK